MYKRARRCEEFNTRHIRAREGIKYTKNNARWTFREENGKRERVAILQLCIHVDDGQYVVEWVTANVGDFMFLLAGSMSVVVVVSLHILRCDVMLLLLLDLGETYVYVRTYVYVCSVVYIRVKWNEGWKVHVMWYVCTHDDDEEKKERKERK